MDPKGHDVEKEKAFLESKLDVLETEFAHLDELLKRCGFKEGIDTLKQTVEELLSEAEKEDFSF